MTKVRMHGRTIKRYENYDKVNYSITDTIRALQLRDGMTISFHHHFREGDLTVNQVIEAIHELGIKDLTIFASSLGNVHSPFIKWIKDGTITSIHTSGLRGELAQFISRGGLENPVIIRSHGGRARAIEAGDVKIDIAFLAVPSADRMGNANGHGKNTKCGSLGYAMVDAAFADKVVLLTDDLVDYPNMPSPISQTQVDHVVVLDRIGDPAGIASGATRFTKNPKEILIAKQTAKVITNLEYYKEGFSFQTGSGGASLAVSRFLEEKMLKDSITASFVLGGITEPIVSMHEKGLIRHLFDVQSFDLAAVDSVFRNPNHHVISASTYANAFNMGPITTNLDYVVLSALEIDKSFNVNVMTGSDGVVMGASGGHCDTAESAKCTIIVAPLYRGRIATVVEKVTTVITPGSSVDVLVTDRGIAVNPKRADIMEQLTNAGVKTVSIESLLDMVNVLIGSANPIEFTDRVVAKVEYRDGTIIDRIMAVKDIDSDA
ncbi:MULTISPECIES: citrate lyase subunit alpha [unclassified Fusibacter]|uniref:citrate lyase subunit alpha n=1 Tax=unclassified Fusibacter TaxID=2624464 RepID=UPI0010136626|nr:MULTISPECIES: citrate lyase subunit alpha [unclassified Fusibacter]MCK8058597.1 citrate lyase subunit alpha [Fusibacter sp. A2]NPE22633.1 citrate lyase subunit alpha [Fusibacter sp. A1]RXV60197.1 citrate lyase subunit alpha [Fusibacter sp. A1]